jgi:hypothetical protein
MFVFGIGLAFCKIDANANSGGTPLQGPTAGGMVPTPITRVIDNILYLFLFSF